MRCKFLIPPVLMSRRFLHILGIESSCDDAAVAIVNSEERRVLVDRRSADDESLLRLGGVLPYACARHHRSVIGPLIEKAFDDANLRSSDIDAVAVSTRPGIINCLKGDHLFFWIFNFFLFLHCLVGVEHALGFARCEEQSMNFRCCIVTLPFPFRCFRRPLVPVHHMRAHALVARLLHPHLSFPFLTLIASGAHCLICIVHGPNKFYVLADSGGGSPGECLDKLARELSLDPHKGSFAAQMEQIAKKCPPDEVCRFALPSWSFGDEMDFNAIKCRYLQLIHRRKEMHKDGTELALWCAGIQHTVTELICQHLAPSLSFFASSNSPNKCILVLAGGVAANEYFRLRVKDIVIQRNFDEVIVLPQELCTDNGVMVAWTGAEILAHKRGERGTKRNEQMAPLFEETDQSDETTGEIDQSEETTGEIDQSEDIVIHRPFPDSISVSARSQIGPFHDQFRQQKHLYS